MSKLRAYLPFVVVFAVVFVLTVYLAAPGAFGVGGGPQRTSPSLRGEDEVPASPFGRIPSDTAAGEAPKAESLPKGDLGADRAPGTLRVFLRDEDGAPIFGASASLHPADGGHHKDLPEGGFEIRQLAPGAYRLLIWSDHHVPKTLPAVRVRPGATDRLEVELERGAIPRGSVHDEKDKRPIEGAVVTLGLHTFRTDADGTFAGVSALPKSSLKGVRVEHPDYDSTTYIDVPGLDLENLQLPMTRGDATLAIRVVNESGRWAPSQQRVQVFRELGGNDRLLKRDRLTAAAEVLELRGLHAGIYTVTVSFPETELVARSLSVRLDYRDRREVTVSIDAGADVEGRVVQRLGRVAQREFSLIDEQAIVRGTARSDREGRFAFRSVPTGTYALRTSHGGPRWNTVNFEVPDSGVLRVSVDFDSQRLTVLGPPETR